jgi:hypothetical protein
VEAVISILSPTRCAQPASGSMYACSTCAVLMPSVSRRAAPASAASVPSAARETPQASARKGLAYEGRMDEAQAMAARGKSSSPRFTPAPKTPAPAPAAPRPDVLAGTPQAMFVEMLKARAANDHAGMKRASTAIRDQGLGGQYQQFAEQFMGENEDRRHLLRSGQESVRGGRMTTSMFSRQAEEFARENVELQQLRSQETDPRKGMEIAREMTGFTGDAAQRRQRLCLSDAVHGRQPHRPGHLPAQPGR